MNHVLELGAEFYDLHTPKPSEEAIDFYLHYFREGRGPVLEPMCGSGRYLIPLSLAGCMVDGTDASTHMLAACRERSAAVGLEPRLSEQLLHELDVPRKYAMIMIPAGSFCAIHQPEQVAESLRRIREHLLPGGKFLVEILQLKGRKSEVLATSGCWVDRPDGSRIIFSWLGFFLADERVAHTMGRYELVRDGRLVQTEFEDMTARYYEVGEFRALLNTAGFASVRVLRLNGWEPAGADDDRVVFEATAP